MSRPLNSLETAWCEWLDGQDAIRQAIHEERPALSQASFAGGVLAERARIEAALLEAVDNLYDSVDAGATGVLYFLPAEPMREAIQRVCAGKEADG